MNYLKQSSDGRYRKVALMVEQFLDYVKEYKPAFESYFVHALIISVGILLDPGNLRDTPGGFLNPYLTGNLHPLIDKFIRWDAHWYTYIAQNGYDEQSIVFFPAIIILIRILAPVFNYDFALTGFLICNFFGLYSFIMLYRLFSLDYSHTVAAKALLAYAVFPTSFYLNSIYTEPIFVTFSAACMYYCRRGQWRNASLFAIFTALSRNIGVFLAFAMAYEAWRQRSKVKLSTVAPHILAAPAAMLGVMSFNYLIVSDWFAFINSQKLWGREFSFPWFNISNSIVQIFQEYPNQKVSLLLDFGLVIFILILLLLFTLSFRNKLPVSYLIIGWIWFLVPLFSTAPWQPLYSMSRFALVVFPIYLAIAQLPLPCYWVIITVCATTLGYVTLLFSNWHWIS